MIVSLLNQVGTCRVFTLLNSSEPCQEGFKGKFDFLYLPIDFRRMRKASFLARSEVQGRFGLRFR